MASTERTPDAGAAPTATPAASGNGTGAGAGTQPASAPAPAAGRLLLFGVRGRLYGCHIQVVREIIPFRPCTRLPGAPPYVCGLINLRGTIVTVIDLGMRLVGQPVDRAEGSIILVEHGAKVAGVGVEELRDVQSVPYQPMEGARGGGMAIPPAAGEHRPDTADFMLGLATIGGEVAVVLDVQAIVKQALL